MKKLLIIFILSFFSAVGFCAVEPTPVMVNTNGVLLWPSNFFSANPSATNSGEANTVGDAGLTNATSMSVFSDKDGVVLNFRTLTAGSGVVITNEGTNLVIAATASGGGGGPGTIAMNDTQFDTNAIVSLIAGAFQTNFNSWGSGTNNGNFRVTGTFTTEGNIQGVGTPDLLDFGQITTDNLLANNGIAATEYLNVLGKTGSTESWFEVFDTNLTSVLRLDTNGNIRFAGSAFTLLGSLVDGSGGVLITNDSGTVILGAIDAIDATTETTFEAALELNSLQGTLALNKGGTGTGDLADPGQDTILVWDDNEGKIKFANIGPNLNYDDGIDTLSASGGSGSPITFREADGTPIVTSVTNVVVTNDTLTDDGDGNITLTLTGGSGDSVSIDGSAVTDPDFVSTGDVDFVDNSNTITANLNEDVVDPAHMADGDHGFFSYSGNVATLDNNGISSLNFHNAISDPEGTGEVVFDTSPTFPTNIIIGAAGASLYSLGGGQLRMTAVGGSFPETLSIALGGTDNVIVLSSDSGADELRSMMNITEAGAEVPNENNHLGFFAATTSSQFAGVISDEVGTGSVVLHTDTTLAGTTYADLLEVTNSVTINGASTFNDDVTINAALTADSIDTDGLAVNGTITADELVVDNLSLANATTNLAHATSITFYLDALRDHYTTNAVGAAVNVLLTNAVPGNTGSWSLEDDGTGRTLSFFSAHPMTWMSTNGTVNATNFLSVANKYALVCWSVRRTSPTVTNIFMWGINEP
jgi:hypothetical protein